MTNEMPNRLAAQAGRSAGSVHAWRLQQAQALQQEQPAGQREGAEKVVSMMVLLVNVPSWPMFLAMT